MERTEKTTLTNMCMIYDAEGNVVVQEKIRKNYKGIIFPGGHVENHESIVRSSVPLTLHYAKGRVDAPLTVARPSQNPDVRLSRIRLFTKLIIHNHLS